MSRLIDADALKKEWSMGNKCEECGRDACSCQYYDHITMMDVCSMLDDAPTVSGWVSVKDRLPCNTQDVLVYAKGLLVKIGAYIVQSNEWWVFGLGGEYIVEYWMPLPEPPKEDEKHG